MLGLDWREPGGGHPPVLVAEELLGDGVVAAFTTRLGGGSQPPFDSCNLGLWVGDSVRAVLANRRRVANVLGVSGWPWATVRQVHGGTAVRADGAGLPPGPPEALGPLAEADGLATASAGVVLAVTAADCVPVLLADTRARVVAAAHAGWRGTAAGVVEETAAAMAALGADPAATVALVGPAVGPCCYPVGEQAYGAVTGRYPRAAARSRDGSPALDLAAAAVEALARAGIGRARVAGDCTADDPERFFSHRRDGRTGRQAGVIALAPAGDAGADLLGAT